MAIHITVLGKKVLQYKGNVKMKVVDTPWQENITMGSDSTSTHLKPTQILVEKTHYNAVNLDPT
jgi:hypothetical protein